MTRSPSLIEGLTLALIFLCYVVWAASLWIGPWGMIGIALTVTLHSSLQHEVIHGHPTPWPWLNTALVAPAIGFLIPFHRFRDTHLAHHHDAILTDPYDDPESNYLDPQVWARLSRPLRLLLRANNTLLGRIVLGPAISIWSFYRSDLAAIRNGDRATLHGWLWHIPAVLVVVPILVASPMPAWGYWLGLYGGLAILKIRTYAEHRAHAHSAARTIVIEDRGPLALLFLNNNFHAVHHMHPDVAWYQLPALYRSNRDRYLTRNDGYVLPSYRSLAARHLLTAKDPVPHPLRPSK